MSDSDDVKTQLTDQDALLGQTTAVLGTMGNTLAVMDKQLTKVFDEVAALKAKVDQGGASIPSDVVQLVATHGKTIATMRETLAVAGGQLQGALAKLQEVDNLDPDADTAASTRDDTTTFPPVDPNAMPSADPFAGTGGGTGMEGRNVADSGGKTTGP